MIKYLGTLCALLSVTDFSADLLILKTFEFARKVPRGGTVG